MVFSEDREIVRHHERTAAAPAEAPTVLPRQVDRPQVEPPTTGPLDLSQFATAHRPRWVPYFVFGLLMLDPATLMTGGYLGQATRFARVGGEIQGMPYNAVIGACIPVWLFVLAASGCYERGILGWGAEEYRRVTNGAARFTAVVALAMFLVKWQLARGLVVVALPTALLLTLLARFFARKVLHVARASGSASHRVLVVGDGTPRDHLVEKLRSSYYYGLEVVGVCRIPAAGPSGERDFTHMRWLAGQVKADTVAVAHSPHVSSDLLRRLAWSLEGADVDLLVAPALTDIAGPRIHVRPVSGLPLLQIAEPQFTGIRRVVKGLIDFAASAVLLVLLSPVFLVVALIVRSSSPGPVFFRQVRIGRDGKAFTMLKFRSMYADAEDRLDGLVALNDHGDGGVLFKLHDDPRITRIGKTLRRYSFDELPQLINVLRADMSLVGPRPPLPSEVAQYERDVHRRLLVKPGITGLWQVSGRSDLDWDETVRLDLYYVENWSVALDTEIVWKTVWAVAKGSGAR